MCNVNRYNCNTSIINNDVTCRQHSCTNDFVEFKLDSNLGEFDIEMCASPTDSDIRNQSCGRCKEHNVENAVI